MRKLLVFVASALWTVACFAEIVSEADARMAAARFVDGSRARFSSGMKSSSAGTSADNLSLAGTSLHFRDAKYVSPSVGEPTYYVYNVNGGGFVIISGDDTVAQILAYSDEGSIDMNVMPEGMKWWMGKIDEAVKTSRKYSSSAADESWSQPKKAGTPVVTLNTAKWDQEAPYNNECPVLNGRRCMTGCVATAAAIVCRFNEWPTSGTGTLPSYSYTRDPSSRGRNTVESRTLGRKYDYENMPLTYTNSATSVQKAAVAALMADLGCGCKMMYDYDGSGAYTDDLLSTLVKNFHYKSTATLKSRSSYQDNTWIGLLKKELDAKRPIIYGGVTTNREGHQFVFDGYDSQNYFHVNWGWSGSGNGYFLITSLGNNTTVGYVFSQGQDAILDLVPDGKDPVVYNADQIAATTSLIYSKTETAVRLTPQYDIHYTLKGPAGFTTLDGDAAASQTTSLKLSASLKGTYTLTLVAGGTPYELVIKL